MTRTHLALAAAAALVGLTTGPPTARADFLVVPNALEAANGSGSSNLLIEPSFSTLRYQQVYASSEFDGPGLISQIAFRPGAPDGNPFSALLANTRISLSTTSRMPDGLSTTFTDNVGTDEVVVFTGNLTLSSADLPGPGGTRAFDVVIDLATPYSYDPTRGNLLLDFARDASSVRADLDAQDTVGDPISRVFGLRGSATAIRGDTFSMVTRFTITQAAVPEPASLALAGVAAAGLGVARWRRRATKADPPREAGR